MRAIELKQAKRRLSTYAKMAFEAPVLLTAAGKPYVVMTRAAEADVEDLAVGSSPAFLAVMERSEARYRAEGGLSTEEARARAAGAEWLVAAEGDRHRPRGGSSGPPSAPRICYSLRARHGRRCWAAAPGRRRGVMVTPVPEHPRTAVALQREGHLWDDMHVLLRRRRLVLGVFFGVLTLVILRTLLTQPVYQSTAQILIERTDPTVLSFKEVSQVDAGRDDYYQTQYKLLQSRSLAQRVIEQLNLLNDPEYGGPRTEDHVRAILAQPPGQSREMERAIDAFLARLSVSPVRNSRLVVVAVSSHSPQLAAQATNALATLYIQQSLDLRTRTSSEAGQWLGTQVDEQRKKVEELETRFQGVRESSGIVNVEERRALVDQKLKELGTSLNELKSQRLQKEALWRQMGKAPNPEELPEVMRSPIVQALGIELASLEREQAQLLERYLDEHPEVVKVRNQIQDTQQKLRAESQRVIRAAENDYKAAAAQEASVAAALEAAKQEALDLSRKSISYDSQKREVEAAKQVLDSIMARGKETDVAQELKSSNIRIVDPAAVPQYPVRPRKLHDIVVGAILAAFLSFGHGLLPRVSRQHAQDPRRRPRVLRRAATGCRAGACREARRRPARRQRQPAGPLRGRLPRRPHRPRLFVARARSPRAGRDLHVSRRGQDPDRGEPGADAGFDGEEGAARRRRHAQAPDARAGEGPPRARPVRRPRGQGRCTRDDPAGPGGQLARLPSLGQHRAQPFGPADRRRR